MDDLTSQIECTAQLIGKGGFGCVYKGRWLEEAVNTVRPRIVAKVMNFSLPIGEKQKKKQSRRELELWSKINHKNILPLLGIANINPDANIPAFISAWMENGNAKQFRLRNPDFPPLLILHDVIQGLHYLHTFKPEIVHGDIKAVNVLINNRYEALLCDFGLSRFLVDNTLWRTTATQAGGSLPWMSPELMTGKQKTPTKESDIYAYAMTCYEILSGNAPFESVPNNAALIYSIIEKQRPQQVQSCDLLDDMWDIITECWAEEPEDRPRTAKVRELVWTRTQPFFKATIETASDLTGQIECSQCNTDCIGRGGFGCVYKGRWVEEATDAVRPPIVVKVMNFVLPPVDERNKEKQSKQIKRELELWSKIKHKNILPLLGIANINPDANIPAFISAWMENGNAKQFLSRKPDFPPLLILHDVIQGLHYLHTFKPEIVHGDIKAVNVLINDRYEARLCDFGLSRFLVDSSLWITTATHARGTLRWMAPELMNGKQKTPTKESDIYAYAMICYEILSGDVPFKSARNDGNVMYSVTIDKERPQRVESCDLDDMWDIITKCWAEEPEDRPRTAEVQELVWIKTPPYPLSFSIGQSLSSACTTVNKSNFYTANADPLPESDERTVLTKSTNRYLSVSKILETEDERMVEGSLIESTSRRYLKVTKVLEN